MRDWMARLKLMDGMSRLHEPLCDCFEAAPPSKEEWPEGLPKSPALKAFYDACDGGRMGVYSLLPRGEILGDTASLRDWADDLEANAGLTPGRWFVLGHHEVGHALLWDAEKDALFLYDADATDRSAKPLNRTLSEFWGRLFFPSSKSSNESVQLWREAIAALESLGTTSPASEPPP